MVVYKLFWLFVRSGRAVWPGSGQALLRDAAIPAQHRLTTTILIFFLTLLATNCHQTKEASLTIAAASSLRPPLERLIETFTTTTGKNCQVVYGSSGKLTAQITAGAPYHVLLSANQIYPDTLVAAGLAEGPITTFGFGQLVLWTAGPAIAPTPRQMLPLEIRSVALPNPRTAPYGVAAREYLTYTGLLDVLEPKLVYGESVAQASQFVMSGAAEMGFTSLSTVLSLPEEERKPYLILPGQAYAPIAQSIVIVTPSGTLPHPDAAAFRTFLLGPEARSILLEFGYLTD